MSRQQKKYTSADNVDCDDQQGRRTNESFCVTISNFKN